MICTDNISSNKSNYHNDHDGPHGTLFIYTLNTKLSNNDLIEIVSANNSLQEFLEDTNPSDGAIEIAGKLFIIRSTLYKKKAIYEIEMWKVTSNI